MRFDDASSEASSAWRIKCTREYSGASPSVGGRSARQLFTSTGFSSILVGAVNTSGWTALRKPSGKPDGKLRSPSPPSLTERLYSADFTFDDPCDSPRPTA